MRAIIFDESEFDLLVERLLTKLELVSLKGGANNFVSFRTVNYEVHMFAEAVRGSRLHLAADREEAGHG